MKTLLGFIFILFSTVSSASTTSSTDFAELYAEHIDSVVTIYTANISTKNGKKQVAKGVGSGFLVEDNQIITAAHVVEGAAHIEILFNDGKRIKGDVISSLKASDIALIKLQSPHPTAPVAVLADSDETAIGSEVFIIGSPFGISKTLSVGHLSGRMNRGLMAGGTPIEFLQTDTAINTGNSGGPMFNTKGEVIGIVSFILTKSGGFEGIGFAASSNTARQALLTSSGVLAGFEGVLLDERVASALNFPGPGLLVQRVVADSIVDEAGLLAGDIPTQVGEQSFLLGGDLILEINGLVCATPHDFELVRASTLALQEEDTYSISVFRDGEIVELIAGTPLGSSLNIAH